MGYLPRHETYVEPFGGAACVLFHKRQSQTEIYNDKWFAIYNMFRTIRDRPDELQARLSEMDTTPEEFNSQIRIAYHGGTRRDGTDVAAAIFYTLKFMFGSDMSSKWNSADAMASKASGFRKAVSDMHMWSERLRNVVLLSKDFREVIGEYDSPDTLFNLDPPYFGKKYYLVDFAGKDHSDLAAMLKEIEGKAVVSYYLKDENVDHTDLLEDLYPPDKWTWATKLVRKTSNYGSGSYPLAIELLAMNYSPRRYPSVGVLPQDRKKAMEVFG